MNRIDVKELLEEEDIKPMFLSKSQRQELALKRRREESEAKRKETSKKFKAVTYNDEIEIRPKTTKNSEKPKHKFQFDWDDDDDTLAGYKPITIKKIKVVKTSEPKEEDLGKHWAEKSLEEMTLRDWRIMKEDYSISSKGASIANPLRNWKETGIIPSDILDILHKNGYTEPTPIQRIAIPNSMGRDIIGVASTGSGKTMAFLIPMFLKMLEHHGQGTQGLVLVPTRELAQQIETEAKKFTKYLNISVVSIVGGHSLEEIAFSLSNGADIVVATPGRLLDSLEHKILVLNQVSTLVLDEADRMIDLGFEDQLKSILSRLPAERHTMMFTATISPPIEKIAIGYLKKPAYLTIGKEEKPEIEQILEYLDSDEQKLQRLQSLLPQFCRTPIVIFINYKKTADWLFDHLKDHHKITILHGSKSQEQREHSIQQLRTGKVNIMIATNVAARGIDIPNVGLVVNFQMSFALEDYIHRIGRTGRAGQSGVAITFLDKNDELPLVNQLCKYVRQHDGRINDSVRQNFDLQDKLKAIV